MWRVHVVDLGKLFKIWRVVEKLIQNLTRQKFFLFKIWQHEKILFKITLFYKNFFNQNIAF